MTEGTCSIAGCGRYGRIARGMCMKHYARWRRHGQPEVWRPGRPTAEQRFMAKVDTSGECWEWTAKRDRSGYGRFWYREDASYLAHRAAYELFVGPIPDGLVVCHRCDNPGCVNPRHLWLGTMADNNWDKVAKGRASGPRSGAPDCARGHPFDEVNTRWYRGKRNCRTCANEAQRRRRRKAQ